MNMQQMVQAMQKTQRMYEKEHAILEQKEFSYTANSAIKLTLKGDMSFVSLEFLEPSMLEEDNAEMIADIIKIAYEEIRNQILDEEDKLAEKFKTPGGLGF